jgi:hypothetical protein
MVKPNQILALTVFLGASISSAADLQSHIEVVPCLPGQYRWIQGIIALPAHTFLILDADAHRLLSVSKNGNLIRQIGSVGQEPGDFQHPSAVSVGADGEIVVLDSDNYRVQKFRKDGSFVSLFSIGYYAESLTVISNGNIIVNSPTRNAVFSIYSPSGKLLRSAGRLLGESVGYPGHESRQWSLATMNRAVICADRSGGFYVVYMFMPVVQRFSAQGELLWEKRLTGPAIDEAAKSFWHEPGARKAHFFKKIYGVQLPVVISAAASLPNGRLIIAVADSSIIELADTGEQLATISTPEHLPGAILALAYQGSYLYLAFSDQCFRTRDPIRF